MWVNSSQACSPGYLTFLVQFYDEVMAFDECYATYRQAHDFIGVWDIDEYFAPAYNHPWTREYVNSYVRDWQRRYPGSPSLQLPMTWPDRTRWGKMTSKQIRAGAVENTLSSVNDAADPSIWLSDRDVQDIADLHQSAAKVQYWHTGELAHYVKSLHNTQNLHGANVHNGWPGPGDEQWQINGGKSPDLIIYHTRSQQLEPEEWYSAPPIRSSVVQHWQHLVHRLRAIGPIT